MNTVIAELVVRSVSFFFPSFFFWSLSQFGFVRMIYEYNMGTCNNMNVQPITDNSSWSIHELTACRPADKLAAHLYKKKKVAHLQVFALFSPINSSSCLVENKKGKEKVNIDNYLGEKKNKFNGEKNLQVMNSCYV